MEMHVLILEEEKYYKTKYLSRNLKNTSNFIQKELQIFAYTGRITANLERVSFSNPSQFGPHR